MKTYVKTSPIFLLLVIFLIASCKKDDDISPIDNDYEENGEVKTLVIYGDTMVCIEVGDYYVYQEDMVFNKENITLTNNLKGAGTSRINSLWPNKTVYYTINSNFINKTRIEKAISHWQNETSLNFINQTNPAGYIEFQNTISTEINSWAHVGYVGKGLIQIIAINGGDQVSYGTVIHEIGHAVGLTHEHSRTDRNLYIKVNNSNILNYNTQEVKSNFDRNWASYIIRGSKLDLNSIMLYYPFAGAINKRIPTITLLDGKTPVPYQRKYLSKGDKEMVEYMYSNLGPIAKIGVIKRLVNCSEQVNFLDLSLKNPSSWHWDFGDGNSSEEQNPIHVYESEGIYTVKLTVANADGSDSEIREQYIVRKCDVPTNPGQEPNNSDLEIEFEAESPDIIIGDTVRFESNVAPIATSYLWDFGDGATSDEQNPSHVYDSPGKYTISLTAANDFGSAHLIKENYISVFDIDFPYTKCTINFFSWQDSNHDLEPINIEYAFDIEELSTPFVVDDITYIPFVHNEINNTSTGSDEFSVIFNIDYTNKKSDTWQISHTVCTYMPDDEDEDEDDYKCFYDYRFLIENDGWNGKVVPDPISWSNNFQFSVTGTAIQNYIEDFYLLIDDTTKIALYYDNESRFEIIFSNEND